MKFTIYIPVAYDSIIEELDKRKINKNKLFIETALNLLRKCNDYQPKNDLAGIITRIQRLEKWAKEQGLSD